MKVFISVGMSGREESDVRRDIERASENIRKLYGENVEIVHNYDCVAPEGSGRLWYLGEAIKQLGDCYACYFCNGWRNSKGCCIEWYVCRLYGMYIHEEEFMDFDFDALDSRYLNVDPRCGR